MLIFNILITHLFLLQEKTNKTYFNVKVEELRQRLEEKNRHIEKKTQAAVQATQERNRINNELSELRDHMDIKDRKINVLQRKVFDDYILNYYNTKHSQLTHIFYIKSM